jgi:sulfite exporter TauE/SafE
MRMENASFYAMFILGVLGTGHCLGMCGPLIVAFPMRSGGIGSHLCYHGGRIATYVAVGSALGAVGAGVTRAAGVGGDPVVWMVRIQVGFSLAAALFLFHFGLTRVGIFGEPRWMAMATPSRIPGFQRIIGAAAAKKKAVRLILVGLMMGFLPCGLSFAAFARALASGSPLSGGLLVLFFGMGTLPGLVLLGTGAAGIIRRYRVQSDILSGLLMIGMAASLVADAVTAVV